MFITLICDEIAQAHISENDEMTTNKWSQFVADEVEHDDICHE